jgi:hypothetical protein
MRLKRQGHPLSAGISELKCLIKDARDACASRGRRYPQELTKAGGLPAHQSNTEVERLVAGCCRHRQRVLLQPASQLQAVVVRESSLPAGCCKRPASQPSRVTQR